MNKTESNIKACEEAAFERCINFIVEMIEKYGNTIIIEDNNINMPAEDNKSIA